MKKLLIILLVLQSLPRCKGYSYFHSHHDVFLLYIQMQVFSQRPTNFLAYIQTESGKGRKSTFAFDYFSNLNITNGCNLGKNKLSTRGSVSAIAHNVPTPLMNIIWPNCVLKKYLKSKSNET